jgi:hypothetical protein
VEVVSTGPDIAGLYAALRRLPDRTPEQREAYRAASSAHTTAKAMQAGRRYRTRDLPRTTAPRPRWREQPRDELGRWARAS